MLDFHSEFTKFNINIKLTTDRKDRIIQISALYHKFCFETRQYIIS